MLIELDKSGLDQQEQIIQKLGVEEILSQLSEECCELAQAAQKVRRVLHGTTPVSMEDAVSALEEEAGDVMLLLDYVARAGVLDMDAAAESANGKNTRWFHRVMDRK